MQKIWDQIDELEARCGALVDTFLLDVTPATLDHEDNICAMKEMSEGLGLPAGVLSSFIRAKLYAKARVHTTDDTPAHPVMAQQLGAPNEDFLEWVIKQGEASESRHQRLIEELPPARPFHWETEQDMLDDLMQDAGIFFAPVSQT